MGRSAAKLRKCREIS